MNSLADDLVYYALQLFVGCVGVLMGVLVVMGLRRLVRGSHAHYKMRRTHE